MENESGKCQQCGKLCSEKYKYCQDCYTNYIENQKKEKTKTTEPNEEEESKIVRALGSLNNNLYALRTMQEFILEQEYERLLHWDKETKRFRIIDEQECNRMAAEKLKEKKD